MKPDERRALLVALTEDGGEIGPGVMATYQVLEDDRWQLVGDWFIEAERFGWVVGITLGGRDMAIPELPLHLAPGEGLTLRGAIREMTAFPVDGVVGVE